MADLEEITETPRTDVNNDSRLEQDRGSAHQNSTKRRRSKRRRGSQSPSQTSPLHPDSEEKQEEDGDGGQSVRQERDTDNLKRGATPAQENHRALFYGDYRKMAKEYDEGFLKKHGGDLDITLIFAGLFSAVTSAFIIEVDSKLQSDPNDETAALLRVLIYKIDNTTFGNHVPTLPQWTGPPRAIVQVQAILFASLVTSLLSAFLAMLGKQWLNRYESIDMRGLAAQRSHDRQRKLDGIIAWYFNHVMDALPLMLQAALFLLGCALSRYLWEINTIVASVVLSFTSFGITFYLFIVVAGTASKNCPYQTPVAHFFRHILHHLHHDLLPTFHSALTATPVVISSQFSRLLQVSECCSFPIDWWSTMRRPWYSTYNITSTLTSLVILPIVPVFDAYSLGRFTFKLLVNLGWSVYRRLLSRFGTPYPWFIHTSPIQKLDKDCQEIVLDLRCISWILQTSLEEVIRLSAFKYLELMPKLVHFHPTLVADCFNIFIGCVSISNGKVAIVQGLDNLATASANGFSRTLHHLATMDPTSSALAELQRRYNDFFPSDPDFTGLPPSFSSTMTKIHALAGRFGNPRDIQWLNQKLSIQEHIPFARGMVKAAQEKYQQTPRGKVPLWILRPTLYLLSLGPLSPAAVVADCLKIVAIDLGCDVSNIEISDESTRVERVSSIVTQKLDAMIKAADSDMILSKRKAINTLLPYAIYLEQRGQQGMFDTILRAARVSNSKPSNTGKFIWGQVVLYISRLFEKRSPTSLDRVITLIAPYVPWDGAHRKGAEVVRWATAASTIPYTEEVGASVVDVLFQIAWVDPLRPHIPTDMWGWLKRRPPLPSMYDGLPKGGSENTVVHVRRLRDIDVLKSYFLLVWGLRYTPDSDGTHAMKTSIREDFGGVEMEQHRKDLLERLEYIIPSVDRRLVSEHDEVLALSQQQKKYYTKLRDTLLEVGTR